MAVSHDSLININDNKSKWYFFARIHRLWTSTNSNNSEKPTATI